MLFAAPLKTKKEDSAITKVLGKAKYFGIYDDEADKLEVIENKNQGGPSIFFDLHQKGVNVVLTPHAGPGAVEKAYNLGIKLYYCGEDRKTLKEAVKEFKEGKYQEITPENFHQFHR